MEGTAILTEIVEILVGAIVPLGEAVGAGLSSLVRSIFLTTAGGLSVFGVLVVTFSGISLAIGLCRLIVHWLSTLGGSRV